MCARMDRPLKTDLPRNKKLTVRLNEHELEKIAECAALLEKPRTDAIVLGIDMLLEELTNKKETAQQV